MSNNQPRLTVKVLCIALACAVLGARSPARAQAQATSAVITASLLPHRASSKATLTFSIVYAGGTFGIPAPVRHSVLQLPAGLSLDIPTLRSCSAARLRARGVHGCPAQSLIGRGHALAETRAGSQTITEQVQLWAFLGAPRRDLQPTFEILSQGYTPLDERVVLSGTVLPDYAPYGEELTMSIPPIPALPFEPDASIVSFSLTIGATGRGRAGGRDAASVLLPHSCPAAGLPFAAQFTYADGSTSSTLATTPCPA